MRRVPTALSGMLAALAPCCTVIRAVAEVGADRQPILAVAAEVVAVVRQQAGVLRHLRVALVVLLCRLLQVLQRFSQMTLVVLEPRQRREQVLF